MEDKAETLYALRKKVAEQTREIAELNTKLYEYRMACSEIYDGAVEVLGKGNTSLNISWILGRLKRAWMKI